MTDKNESTELSPILIELIDECDRVAVFPNNEIYFIGEIPTWKSDDYEIRYQGYCMSCDSPIEPEYGLPIASCECGSQEWYI